MASIDSVPRIGACLALGLLIAGIAVRARSDPAPTLDPTAASIEAIVRAARNPELRWPSFQDYQRILVPIYEARGFAPLWLVDGRPTPPARDAIEALSGADAQGLSSLDYDAARLDAMRQVLADGGAMSPETLAVFDTGVTIGLLRYISDQHIGRVNPKKLDFGYDIDPKKYDLAALLPAAVREDRIARVVAEAPPGFSQYRQLTEQLARYRALAADPGVASVALEPPIRPGDACSRAADLARWLMALGDLPESALAVGDVYEGALVEGVTRFQTRHGLAPDGVIGAATARALAVPAARRARQIELALERLRWIPPLESGRVIFVNIPAFELSAFDELGAGAAPALTMPVVVGKAYKTQTPVFAGALQTVAFAPYWNVPRSITRNEIVPKLRRNPGYLAAQGMEIVSGGAALPVSAATIDDVAAGRAKLRQRPGPRNALGRVKFLFPNAHNVYLHDTPSQAAFGRSRRDMSHGCVRVARPFELAGWVLAGRSEWTPAAIRAAMAGRQERMVRVDPPVPVVIFYTTAVVRRDGTLHFYDDIYGHDAALERALAAGYPYPS